ncbi:UNVERIFIED_CONTAM: hypothetical protein FKN15_033821 [Acipenser sinensis]
MLSWTGRSSHLTKAAQNADYWPIGKHSLSNNRDLIHLAPGVPVQSGDTSPFNRVMDNLTVRQGDSVLLRSARAERGHLAFQQSDGQPHCQTGRQRLAQVLQSS